MLWREDGYNGVGLAEDEHTETESVPGLAVINERRNPRAETITAERFEELRERAGNGLCQWITKLTGQYN
ncbi:hypothetical protein [Streptomyces sp. NPDC047009]|uniref:hypothetical protein n=1 Tax=Streptomyces sp. NPDC047009 TaxID=3154496 RepID=UPI0033FDD6AE